MGKFLSAGGDRGAGAVETEAPQHLLTLVAIVPCGELGLGEGEAVTEVQGAVHVRVRERHEELGFFGVRAQRGWDRGIGAVRLLLCPQGLCLALDRAQGVPLRGGGGVCLAAHHGCWSWWWWLEKTCVGLRKDSNKQRGKSSNDVPHRQRESKMNQFFKPRTHEHTQAESSSKPFSMGARGYPAPFDGSGVLHRYKQTDLLDWVS